MALLNNTNAVLTGVAGDVATIKTATGAISVKVDDLMALLAKVNATVTDVKNGVATIQTDVGTIKADVNSIKGGVSDIKSSESNIASIVSGASSTAQTTMWLVVITFLVSLVSLVFIFRRK